MKYVNAWAEDQPLAEVFMFSNGINHDCFHEHLMHMPSVDSPLGEYYRPVSAGFIYPNFTCFGRSETLNLDSNEADNGIIASQLAEGMNYIIACNETDIQKPLFFAFPSRITVEEFFKNLRTVRVGNSSNWRRVNWFQHSCGKITADRKCSVEADNAFLSKSFFG